MDTRLGKPNAQNRAAAKGTPQAAGLEEESGHLFASFKATTWALGR
jgi:hypothetical protein